MDENSTPKKSSLKLILSFILAGLTLIIISGLIGFFLAKKQTNVQLINQLTPTPYVSPTSVQTITIDETENWKTYTDPGDQFSFNYPPNYTLENDGNIYLNRNITWRFSNISSLDCRGDCPIIESKENSVLGGKFANKLSGYIGSIGGNIPQRYITYEVPLTNDYFIFSIQALPYISGGKKSANNDPQPIQTNDLVIFDRILSTFKFLNQNQEIGYIEGSLSYPSEGIPNLKICAEDINNSEKKICTEKNIEDKKYTYGKGYILEVPPGKYYVYVSSNRKVYYSEFVTCGLNANCPSHKPITIEVVSGQTVTNIDPQDWYSP